MIPLAGMGQAMTFSTSSSVHGNKFDFDRTNAFTLSTWVKFSSVGNTTYTVAGKYGGPGYLININPYADAGGVGRIGFYADDGTRAIAVRTATAFNDGNWHNVIIGYNGTSTNTGISIYVDGVVQSLVNLGGVYLGASIHSSANFQLGARTGLTAPFAGSMADSRMYSRILSAPEVSAIFNAYPRGSDGIIRGLVGRWLGSPSTQTGATIPNGAIIADLSGNGNHGYATNGVISAPSIIGNRRTK
jgi:hypothetical protein